MRPALLLLLAPTSRKPILVLCGSLLPQCLQLPPVFVQRRTRSVGVSLQTPWAINLHVSVTAFHRCILEQVLLLASLPTRCTFTSSPRHVIVVLVSFGCVHGPSRYNARPRRLWAATTPADLRWSSQTLHGTAMQGRFEGERHKPTNKNDLILFLTPAVCNALSMAPAIFVKQNMTRH